jgi:hypothetical protein
MQGTFRTLQAHPGESRPTRGINGRTPRGRAGRTVPSDTGLDQDRSGRRAQDAVGQREPTAAGRLHAVRARPPLGREQHLPQPAHPTDAARPPGCAGANPGRRRQAGRPPRELQRRPRHHLPAKHRHARADTRGEQELRRALAVADSLPTDLGEPVHRWIQVLQGRGSPPGIPLAPTPSAPTSAAPAGSFSSGPSRDWTCAPSPPGTSSSQSRLPVRLAAGRFTAPCGLSFGP